MDNSTDQSERDHRIRNKQLKNAWLKLKQRENCATIDRGNSVIPNKAVSLIYLSVGTEGRRIFGSQEPTIQIDQISTKDLWNGLDNVFTKQRDITFDHYTFLTQKQLKGEPVEEFYGCLRELSRNCDIGSYEESINRDVFIANMQMNKYRECY